MTKRRGLVLVVVFVVLAFVGYARYERFPWIDAAAYAHSERGSANCGHIVEPDYQAAQAAINCATSAHQQRRPFVVIFSVHGIDEQISNAIVGDSKANALEIMYATGMVTNANMLLRHRCNVPVQLQIQEATAYRIPRLHCAPWPPAEFEKDHLLW